MKLKKYYILCFVVFLLLQSFSCSENKKGFDFDMSSISSINNPDDSETNTSYLLPDIDLTNWKVTLPIGNPTSVRPPEILDYATNDVLKPYMYNDSIEGALVFFTKPGSSTPIPNTLELNFVNKWFQVPMIQTGPFLKVAQ